MIRGIAKKQPTKAEVLKALEKSAGQINDAVALLGMSRTTFYSKWRHHPDIENFLVKISEAKFDEISEILIDLCRQGNTTAIGLALRYSPSAHNAGWTDTRTVTVKNEKPLSDNEKEQLKKELFG